MNGSHNLEGPMKLFILLALFILTACQSSVINLESKGFLQKPHIKISDNSPILHLNKTGPDGLELEVQIEGLKVIITPKAMSTESKHRFKVNLAEINGKLAIIDSSELYYFWLNPDGNLKKLEVK